MTYKVELTATARGDIREAALWRRAQGSSAAAERWLAGLDRAIRTLETRPLRCPVAAESDRFPEEIRELLYGRGKHGKHRILFTIAGGTVSILFVRHTARDELRP